MRAALVRRQEGQTMAEYAVVLGVITIGVVLAFLAFSGAVQEGMERAAELVGLRSQP